jgi:hypothetical protein
MLATHAVKIILPSRVLSKDVKSKTHETIIVYVILYRIGVKLVCRIKNKQR